VIDRPARESLRFAAAAFVADWAFYLVFTSVPLRAIELGAGPLILGLLPALSSTVYIVCALGFGRLSDRGGRMKMARLGTVSMALGALLLRTAPSLPLLFLFLPLVSIGGGLFWPAIQAELGDRGSSGGLVRRMGFFNVAWSAGKMLGFWTAGHLAQAYGASNPLLFAVAFEAAVFVLTPPDRARAPDTARIAAEEAPEESLRARYRLVARLANLVAFGVGATLNYQFPKRLFGIGLHAGDLGNFLGLVGLWQTLAFALLAWRRGWEWRPSILIATLVLGMASVGALAWARHEALILACAPGIGIATGVAYSASLYHSLHSSEGRGRNTGIHEALLGSGAFFLPLVGGTLVGTAGLGAPYLLCAAAFAVVALLAMAWLRAWRPAGATLGSAGRPI
jgi:MFS transporter, DHA1 family, tetracycline resistance protein